MILGPLGISLPIVAISSARRTCYGGIIFLMEMGTLSQLGVIASERVLPSFSEETAEISSRSIAIHASSTSWQSCSDLGFIAAWDNLSDNAVEANPFNESWFLLPALRQFDPDGKVQLAQIWTEPQGKGQLIGLMPVASEKNYGRWPLPHLTNWLHYNAFSGAPLVRRGYEQQFWRALLPWLDAKASTGLFFHISGMNADGPLALALADIASEQGRRFSEVHRMERALLLPSLNPDAYFEQNVRSKKRKELRRQKNRLAEIGALTFERQTDDAELSEWIESFLALENSGWKGAEGSALSCSVQTRSLFADALSGAAMQGKLERLTYRLDGRPIAMLANFHTAGGSFSFKTAFDEDLSRFSPGVLLQIENFDLLDRPGFQYCDSCAAQGHPMIDGLWADRRTIGRYSVAIGGGLRRMSFAILLRAELSKARMGD
jgi:hypothetical protein